MSLGCFKLTIITTVDKSKAFCGIQKKLLHKSNKNTVREIQFTRQIYPLVTNSITDTTMKKHFAGESNKNCRLTKFIY